MTGAAARVATVPPWAAWCLVGGGAAMVGLWIIFTASHGPTSFNENHLILGRGMHVWGMLLGVVPNVLVIAGLVGLRQTLIAGAGRPARIGYVLVNAALAASAAVDLASGALGPPLLLPVAAVGLVIVGLAPGSTHDPPRHRGLDRALLAIGVVLLAAFAMAWIPLEVSDTFGGYRIYGALAHLAAGAGWVVAGIVALQPPAR